RPIPLARRDRRNLRQGWIDPAILTLMRGNLLSSVRRSTKPTIVPTFVLSGSSATSIRYVELLPIGGAFLHLIPLTFDSIFLISNTPSRFFTRNVCVNNAGAAGLFWRVAIDTAPKSMASGLA